jgi:hypothetical protein
LISCSRNDPRRPTASSDEDEDEDGDEDDDAAMDPRQPTSNRREDWNSNIMGFVTTSLSKKSKRGWIYFQHSAAKVYYSSSSLLDY